MASCCQLDLKTKDNASDLWCGGQNRPGESQWISLADSKLLPATTSMP